MKQTNKEMKKTLAGLSETQLQSWSEAFHACRADMVASNASVENGFLSAASDHQALQRFPYTFSIDLSQGSITNQKSSGRCWLFAALNTFRYEIIKNYNLKDFELSQNYLFFYDKLERANYYLENMIRLIDEPFTSRLFTFLNQAPMGDGGQWDMMANLVRKYGVVPKNVYPDGANSIASRFPNQYLTSLLHQDTIRLRRAHQEGSSDEQLRGLKMEMMQDVYRFLCISYGEPPRTFDLTLTDKNGRVTQDFGLDGKTFFAKYVNLDLDDYVSLINAPTADKPYERTYTVKYLGNVEEGRKICYLNLPMEVLKDAAIRQMKDGHPVWFGSDCHCYVSRDHAVFDREASGVEKLLGITYTLTKEERLDYGDSAMNHAMVFLGVNLDQNGRPDRWRIENSWGPDSGPNGGYYIASDSWFDDNVFQVAVNKKYLGEAIVRLLDQPVTELEPWDPMGTLAR